MINNEQYDNLIVLLKQALEFYADENSYTNEFPAMSPVLIDKGFQARFALSKIEELNVLNQKIQDEYDKYTNKMIDNVDDVNDSDLNYFTKTLNRINNRNKNNGNKI
jgi:hypothetical protein